MRILLFILGLSCGLATIAQNGSVQMLARAKEDKSAIMLRWAPTTSLAWELANKHGYTVERITVLRDNEVLNPKEYSVMAPGIIKPMAEAKWEPFIDDNDFAAVVAQAVFGETFELSQDYNKDIMEVVQKTSERDQRFSFALFACDQDFEVAQMAGLGLVDYDVKPGEKYLYRVFANIPSSIYTLDSAAAYIGVTEWAPLPEIADVNVEFGDKGAVVSWNKSLTDRFYNAFLVEKSTDGKKFESVTDKPIINAYSGDEEGVDAYFKLDTLDQNGVTYHYRVRGLNPFGEVGPPSSVVKGIGKPSIDALAGIESHDFNADGSVGMSWEYPKDKESIIDGFVIEVASKQAGPYSAITPEPLGRGLRSYTIIKPRSVGYYRVSLSASGQVVNPSFPYLIQLEDSIAPAAPKNFAHSIDSAGIVKLSWSSNVEDDLWGYRVFRSNFKSAEFSEVTTEPLSEPLFEDTISVRNLTDKMYYKIYAVDIRDNRSTQEEIITIEKPDVIPPSPPVFKYTEVREEGAFITWAPSASTDVTKYVLYRGVPNTGQWEVIMTSDTATSYLDKAVDSGKTYTYTVLAMDKTGLESEPAKPVRVARKSASTLITFDRLSGRSERENKRIVIFWRMKGEGVKEIQVYRSVDGQPISLLKTIPVGEQFVDTQVVQNSVYSYQLRAVLKNGGEVGFSKAIEIKY